MSCPKKFHIEEGTLKIPISRKHECARSFSEALESERPGWHLEVVSKKQTPEGWQVKYRGVSAADWEEIKKLPRAQWPITPDEVWRQDRRKAGVFLKNFAWVMVSILASVGIYLEGSQWVSLSGAQWGLLQKLQSQAPVEVVEKPQQALWIEKMNQLAAVADKESVGLENFEWNQSGAKIQLRGSPAAQSKAMQEVFPKARKEAGVWISQS